jgi:hypothetical protein
MKKISVFLFALFALLLVNGTASAQIAKFLAKVGIQTEVTEKRTENSKTYYLGNNKYRAEISIGAVHYKDDYKDADEQFKDIDLTWVNGKITKAPYTLERIGNKIIVLDKKTGQTGTIDDFIRCLF